MNIPDINICSLREAMDLPDKSRFAHIVSIWDTPESTGPPALASMYRTARFHAAYFRDIEVGTFQTAPPESVRAILEFGAAITPGDAVLVHCLAGVSRSSAVAFALACQASGPGQEREILGHLLARFPWIQPNRRVVALADRILARDGCMSAVVEEVWKHRAGRWHRPYRLDVDG